jgi:DNA-directed RNA polymerase delta subunit
VAKATTTHDLNASVDSPGAFLGMSITDAAKKLLAARRQPLKNPDIAAAFKAGGLHLRSKDPVNTVGAVLTRRSIKVGDIVKIGRGVWGLKEWYPGRSFKKEKADSEEKTEPQAESNEGKPSNPKTITAMSLPGAGGKKIVRRI